MWKRYTYGRLILQFISRETNADHNELESDLTYSRFFEGCSSRTHHVCLLLHKLPVHQSVIVILLLLLFYLRDKLRYLRTYYVCLLYRSNITPKSGTAATFVITDFQTVFICNVLYAQGFSPFKRHIPSSTGSLLSVITLKPKENFRTAFIFVLDYIKMDIQYVWLEGRPWTGLTWLRIGTGGRLLWTRYWTFGFLKMRGTSWLAKNSLAFQEVLFHGVSNPSLYFTSYKNTTIKLVHFSNASYIHVILVFKIWR
jgi:hypothetical protein